MTEQQEESETTEQQEEPVTPKVEYKPRSDVTYESRRTSSIYDNETIYVRKVGYGPVLRVCGNRVLDMRSNTYYSIQGNFVYQDGSGPVFEISGNRIRSAYGGYLYEISGSNINKVFGGFFASISGNYITKFDSSEKYEISSSLNRAQQLTVTALLFGEY